MTTNVAWVPYGRPTAEALRAAIAEAKGDDPLALVTVLVPSNHVGVAARRLLASGVLGPVCTRGTGLVAVNFLTPYRLAELLGAAPLAADGRRPVSTPVIAAALRAALQDNPGLFQPVAAHPATESALVESYRELRDISPPALDALAATGERAAEVVRLHRTARARLEQHWYDEEDLMLSAGQVLRNAGATQAGHGLGAIIVYLPQQLSLHSGQLLAAAAEQTGATVIAATTGSARADAEVLTSLARIGCEVPPSEEFDPTQVVSVERTRFVTASDADEEVRAAVRAVMKAVRNGTPLDRIAILHASPRPYARLIHEQLSAAGIKANGASVMKLSARVAGRVLLQALALPKGGARRQDLFAWLAGAPIHHEGKWAPVTAWERLSREAAVVAGRKDWDGLLSRLAEEREYRAVMTESDPEEPIWKAQRLHEEAERARSLRAFALGLIDNLAQASAHPRGWGEHATWAHKLLKELLGGPNKRDSWPEAERKAAEKVELALDRLASLDHVEGPVSLEVFARTLELELEGDLGRVGRFGEGVLVGSIAMGVGLDLDLVIVLGLAEGAFPARVRDDSLLPDRERAATGGELPLRRQRIDREHRQLLAALAGAKNHLLGVPRGDLRRSSERIPSRWATELASAMAGERWWSQDLLKAKNNWVDHVASFSAGIGKLEFPSTEQEYRLRDLSARRNTRLPGDRDTEDQILAAGEEMVAGRRSSSFTRFDGNLADLTIPSPATSVTSATRLEKWAGCPFGYLLQVVLHVEQVENPEEELTITPLVRGDLIHQVLELFIKEELDRPAEARLAYGEPWSEQDNQRLRAIAEELFAQFEERGQTGRPIFWSRDRLRVLADLLKVLTEDNYHRAAHQTVPVAVELGFGFGQADAVSVALPDGRSVRFRGLADRLDLGRDGRLRVVDYKTGKRDSFVDMSAENPGLSGSKLQLPIYALAAQQHHGVTDAEVLAEYWFTSAKGGFGRIGYVVTPGVLERFGVTLGTIVNGIESGIFPNFPTDAWIKCAFCEPDALGVTDLRRGWERKRSDPALATFVNLVDPEVPGA